MQREERRDSFPLKLSKEHSPTSSCHLGTRQRSMRLARNIPAQPPRLKSRLSRTTRTRDCASWRCWGTSRGTVGAGGPQPVVQLGSSPSSVGLRERTLRLLLAFPMG